VNTDILKGRKRGVYTFMIIPILTGIASYGAVGHMPPSTSSCVIFQVTSELHKLLTFDSMWLPVKYTGL